MPASTKKIVNDVIAALKKHPVPGKKTGSFWEFMKGQLVEDSPWDQSHLKIIEKEIHASLNKIDKKDITELWKNTDRGGEKFDSGDKVSETEMKTDLTDELMGLVMDRMDDNYSSRDTYYSESTYLADDSKTKEEEKGFDDEAEPDAIDNIDIDLGDEDLLNEDFDDEDGANF